MEQIYVKFGTGILWNTLYIKQDLPKNWSGHSCTCRGVTEFLPVMLRTSSGNLCDIRYTTPRHNFIYTRTADKSLARPGRKQARKHVRDARDFNNIETRALIKFLFFP